ncbi:CD59 glycoprotein-like [Solea senegalensis]|uniref:MAC-inhibitory protein n=1 Tax=Solea senegalensis TaxID=28829 RepID=A0AAV6R7M9_SOLSE|nr:CD59 glycoprotein-like [Solea senegalensis]KAG7500509.1 CD59 glycoprotein-like [Solea senegalensis]
MFKISFLLHSDARFELQQAVLTSFREPRLHKLKVIFSSSTDKTALSVAMRSFVVFFLGASFAMFGLGVSLQCYSCPGGSSSSCEVKHGCNQGEDTCLKLTSEEKTYTGCMRYADCDFMTLAVKYSLPDFTFDCCQSNLCNGQEKSFLDKVRDFFG